MQVYYDVNNIIIGISGTLSNLNIDALRKLSLSHGHFYRGSISFKYKDFTLRITRNSHISIYLLKNLNSRLINISNHVFKIYHFLLPFWSDPPHSLNVFVRNIQITFKISFDRYLSLRTFSILFERNYRKKYTVEIKEAHGNEYPWIILDNKAINNHFSELKITCLNTKCIVTILHTLAGSCITVELKSFQAVCEDLQKIKWDVL